MRIHLVITYEMEKTIPESIKIINDFGKINVAFPDINNNIQHKIFGKNLIIEDTEENLIKWLKPFDGFAIGVGSPQLEIFDIVHIKNEL